MNIGARLKKRKRTSGNQHHQAAENEESSATQSGAVATAAMWAALLWTVIATAGSLTAPVQGAPQEGRTVIRGALVVDGSGQDPRRVDVAFEQGRITSVGEVEPREGDRVLQVEGKVLAPGFIDLHSHSRRGLLEDPEAPTQVSQGITTLIVGPDGSSPFPLSDYRAQLREAGMSVNVGLLVGHGTLRSLVMGGNFRRPATAEETAAMTALVRLAMRQGALGLSSGLEYDPGFYSETEELVSLAREAAAHGGIYMSHIRDEEEDSAEAIQEAIEIGRRTGAPVQISHIKMGNKNVWGRSGQALELIDQAVQSGVDVAADCYPYNAWASGLAILVPSRQFDDPAEVEAGIERVGGASNVLITRYQEEPSYEFKSLEEIARSHGVSPVELYIEMMKNGGAGIVGRSMQQDDVDAFYRHPRVMVASDGGTDSRHPRMSGTFPRVLGRFVRQRGLLTLQEAVRKMTSLPASRLGLSQRGRIAAGYYADLVLFDRHEVLDRSDFQNPTVLSQGIEEVWVNGVAVWRDGEALPARPGQLLTRP
ncbi:MAG TPA: D-aminoacylase [Acidobacteriota bacterium]|nr:D-aminoacylase [Acidobacteriota bacterium]